MKQEEKLYREFSEDIRKYQFIDDQTLMTLMSRYVSRIRKHVFVPVWKMKNPYAQHEAKMNYYRFWIKRLHESGIIIKSGSGYAVFKGDYRGES